MKNLSINKIGLVFGILSVVFYIVCTAWGSLFSDVALKALHLQLLQLAYPGFAYTAIGYIVGLIEAVIYGWAIGALLAYTHNKICVENK